MFNFQELLLINAIRRFWGTHLFILIFLDVITIFLIKMKQTYTYKCYKAYISINITINMVCRVVFIYKLGFFSWQKKGNFIYFSMISKTTSEINAWHRKIYHLLYSISNFNSSKSNFIAFTDKVILKETLNLIKMLPSWPLYYRSMLYLYINSTKLFDFIQC